jgi:hypothetical protein
MIGLASRPGHACDINSRLIGKAEAPILREEIEASRWEGGLAANDSPGAWMDDVALLLPHRSRSEQPLGDTTPRLKLVLKNLLDRY